MCASMGYEKVFAFELGNTELDEKQSLLILNELVNIGVYSNTGDGFRMNRPYDEIIRLICSENTMICIYYNDSFVSDICCYLSDEYIVMTELEAESRKLRFTICDRSEFMGLLLLRTNLSNRMTGTENIPPKELLDEEILSLDLDGVPDSSMSMIVHIKKRAVNRNNSENVYIFKKALGNYISYRSNNLSEDYVYSEELLESILLSMLR